MSTNVRAVITAAADEADVLLDGVSSPAEAKPLLLEWLADNHPDLPKEAQAQVVRGVTELLTDEGFFTAGNPQESMADASEFGEPDE